MTTSRSFYAQRAPNFPSPSTLMDPVDVELQSARCLFGEKVKELSVAVAKVDALTRQLEELRSGNTSNSYHVVSANSNNIKVSQEYEKLRNELLYRNKLIDDQNSELSFKKSLLSQKKSELIQIDDRISELQNRLAKKKQMNQQQQQQQQQQTQVQKQAAAMIQTKIPATGYSRSYSSLRGSSIADRTMAGHFSAGVGKKLLPLQVRQSIQANGANVAAVEPMQRLHHSSGDQTQNHVNMVSDAYSNNKNHIQVLCGDAKFQTLPHNTKFGKKSIIENHQTGSTGQVRESPSTGSECIPDSSLSPSVASSSCNKNLVNGFGKQIRGEERDVKRINDSDVDVVDRQMSQQHPLILSSTSTSSDWQKDRRRPINLDDDDMERALSVPMCSSSPEPESKLLHKRSGAERKIFLSGVRNSPPLHPTPSHHHRLQDIIQQQQQQHGTSAENRVNGRLIQNRLLTDQRDENGNECSDNLSGKSDRVVNTISSLSDKTLTSLSSNSTSSSLSSASSSSSSSPNSVLPPVVVRDDCKNTSPDSSKQMVNGWCSSSSTNNSNNNNNSSKEKNSKGNLKSSQNSQSNGDSRPMTRRVSFDPLALLLDAALEGELELVMKTALQVPDPSEAKDEGLTALHNAICACHFPIVKFLVEIGCDVNAQDSEGWTPLHCAASCNNLKMVEFLVEHGASVFATTFSDHETAAEKCEEEEAGFESCSQYLFGIQEKMGVVNGGVVYAVYDYESQRPDELSFRDGDRAIILRKGDDQEIDWWWAKINDREGYVPRTHFALFPRVKPQRRSQQQQQETQTSSQ